MRHRLHVAKRLSGLIESGVPLAGGLERPVLSRDVVKHVARKRIGLERILGFPFSCIAFIAVPGRFGRLGVPEHPVTDTVPDIAHELVASCLRCLATGPLHEIVRRVVEEHVLVADDLLKHGGGTVPTIDIIAQSPANVVEIVVLEGTVQIIRHAEASAARRARRFIRHPVIVSVSTRIAGHIIEHIRRSPLPCLDVAAVIPRADRVCHAVLVDENARQGTVPDIAADLGAAHVDTRVPGTCHHIACHLQGLGIVHINGVGCPHPGGAQSSTMQPIPQNLDIKQMTCPAGERVAPQQSLFQADAMMIGLPEFTILHNNMVHTVAWIHRLHQHATVDVLESAVGNRDVVRCPPHPDAGRVDVLLESEFPRIQPRHFGQVPGHIGESECESRDLYMGLPGQVYQRGLFACLDHRSVRIPAMGQEDVEPAAAPGLFKPVFTLGIVQVVRFVLQVIPVVSADDP